MQHHTGSFCDQAWERNLLLFQATLDLPFNRELAAGTLPRDVFRHYMIQDAHYLVAFGRALAAAAAKADDADGVVQFAAAAQEAVVAERELHHSFMREYAITPEEFASTPLSPTCHHYCHFLQSVAWSRSYPVALAALLPCFWIYAEVGVDLQSARPLATRTRAGLIPMAAKTSMPMCAPCATPLTLSPHRPIRVPWRKCMPPTPMLRGWSGCSGTAPTACRPGPAK